MRWRAPGSTASPACEAEAVCREILAAHPREPNATHLLGLIAHQSGKLDEAIDHLHRAVQFAPDVPLYHANLGEMCRRAGRIEEAVAEGRRAVALKPGYPEALSNVGVALYELKDRRKPPPRDRAQSGLRSRTAISALLTLVRESLPGIEVLGDRGTPSAPIDCECALLSLPRMFKTRLETARPRPKGDADRGSTPG